MRESVFLFLFSVWFFCFLHACWHIEPTHILSPTRPSCIPIYNPYEGIHFEWNQPSISIVWFLPYKIIALTWMRWLIPHPTHLFIYFFLYRIIIIIIYKMEDHWVRLQKLNRKYSRFENSNRNGSIQLDEHGRLTAKKQNDFLMSLVHSFEEKEKYVWCSVGLSHTHKFTFKVAYSWFMTFLIERTTNVRTVY